MPGNVEIYRILYDNKLGAVSSCEPGQVGEIDFPNSDLHHSGKRHRLRHKKCSQEWSRTVKNTQLSVFDDGAFSCGLRSYEATTMLFVVIDSTCQDHKKPQGPRWTPTCSTFRKACGIIPIYDLDNTVESACMRIRQQSG